MTDQEQQPFTIFNCKNIGKGIILTNTDKQISSEDCSGFGLVNNSFTTTVTNSTLNPTSLWIYAKGGVVNGFVKNGSDYTNITGGVTRRSNC